MNSDGVAHRRHAERFRDHHLDLGTIMLRSRKRGTFLTLLRRNSGYLFIFCVLFVFMQLGFHNGRRKHLNVDKNRGQDDDDGWLAASSHLLPFKDSQHPGELDDHPIPHLMEDAELKYRKKMASQSKTIQEAVAEYQRRYRRPPPKGFDQWWAFAQANNVKMVDEYDGLIEDLKPFWELPGEEVRRRSMQAGELPSIDLVRVRDGVATVINVNPQFHDSEVSARAHGFRVMIEKFAHTVSIG